MSEPLWPQAGRTDASIDVLAIGQASLDHVALVDGLPEFAGKGRIESITSSPGGQVATAALAIGRLGLRASLVTTIGDDAEGEESLAPLRAAGLDLAGVRIVAGAPSQMAWILLDRRSGERTVLWHRDPALALVSEDVPEDLTHVRALHLDGGDPVVARLAAERARDAGIPVFLDLDTPVPGVEGLLGAVDFPLVSRAFAEEFFGTRRIEEALLGLEDLGARFPVVTLGDEGALGGAGKHLLRSPAYEIEPVDTTGAGDVFHAAFVVAVLEGRDAAGALRQANGAAAMNCLARGAQGGLPDRAGLEAFLEATPTRG